MIFEKNLPGELPPQQGAITWPSSFYEWAKPNSYQESTLTIQELWKKVGYFLPLKGDDLLAKQAKDWLAGRTNQLIPIVVHLKNSRSQPQSNANLEAWFTFFAECEKFPVKFFLIGNDPLNHPVTDFRNVVYLQNYGLKFECELALISQARLFMGMSSGPCNAALFSNIPFLIWKHPDHHAEIMKKEFGEMGHFPFAQSGQRFFQEWDSFSNIRNAFLPFAEKLFAL
ncbi:MAG: hypothetical protein WA705_08155 [Candidatus Ozemobacteraceae bacterium]